MPGEIKIPPASLWRWSLVACVICSCFVTILLYGMATPVALGQTHTPSVPKTVSAQWAPSLVFTTSALHQLYLPLINTKPVPKQQIAQIDDVTVMVLGDKSPRLRITAYGIANADGWRNPELVLRSAPTTALSAMPAFDFIGEPPAEMGLPVLRPVSATIELAATPLVSGVRVYAMNNAKESPLHGVGQANLLLAPHQPRADEPLQVIVHGIWYDGCVPAYQAHQRESHEIMITTALPEFVCGQSITPWNFSVAVGRLAAGVYTITVGGAVTTTTSFSVANEIPIHSP